MTFISYAQNYEDVILRRAFKGLENGFYIDVGAQDPVIDSVTKHFYDAGWHGINIEPVSEYFKKLQQDRPNDTNLQIAVGAHEGETDFYEVVGTGLSTTDETIAKSHAQKLDFEIKSYKIQTTSLTSICKKHPCPVIHFLKVDVEGSEKSVISGLNLKEIRPWIILIESTCPNTPIENHEEWEPIILAADYEFVYFDGLNRFYVAKEHHEIGKTLAKPPNFFDNFILYSSYFLQEKIAETQASLLKTQDQAEQIKVVQRATEQELKDSNTQVKSLLAKESGLNKQVEIVTAKLDLKDEQLSKLIRQVETVTAKSDLKDEQLSKLTRQVETVTAKMDLNDEQLSKLIRQVETVTAKSALKDEQLQENATALQKAAATLSDLTLQISKLERQVDTVTVESALKDEQLRENKTELQKATEMLSDKTQQIGKLEKQVETLTTQANHNEMLRDSLKKQLQDVYASKSWKITLPLRKLLDLQILLKGLPKKFSTQIFRLKPSKSLGEEQDVFVPNQHPTRVETKKEYPDTEGQKNALSFPEKTLDFDDSFSPDVIARVKSLIQKGNQN